MGASYVMVAQPVAGVTPSHSAVRPEKTPSAPRVIADGVHWARAEEPWVTAAEVPDEHVTGASAEKVTRPVAEAVLP